MSKILNLSNEEVLQRAREGMKFSDITGVKYHLEYPNGGQDPEAEHPFVRLTERGATNWVADCIGFALWCVGISRRFQGTPTIPPFPDTPNIGGGYINTTSIVQEAIGFDKRKGQPPYKGGRFFKLIETPEPGALIVYSGRTKQFPNNPKHGHIGVISSVPAEAPDNGEIQIVDSWITFDTRNHRSSFRVIHCGSSGGKHDNHAVKETHARSWYKNGSIFVRLNREELFGRTVV
jgi:hypothetical protein